MGENLLSLLHIQKLGHPLEEIRLRALSSIISKYNLNLVDENNLENTRVLLEKLFDWLNLDKCPEERNVLILLLKILKNDKAKLILSDTDLNIVLKKTDDIEKKIGCKHPSLIKEIKQCIKIIEDASSESHYKNLNVTKFASIDLTQLNLSSSKSDNQAECRYKTDFHTSEQSAVKLISNELNSLNKNEVKKNLVDNLAQNKSIFKIEFFPWQSLVPNDKQVFSRVFDGLKYIDDKQSIFQSCQFFIEVVLRDFPSEIFLQRPLIIKTFLKLLEASENSTRIPIIKCMIKTVQSLKNNVRLILQPSVINQKKEFYTTSVYCNNTVNCENENSDHINLSDHFYLNFTADEDIPYNHESNNNDQKLKMYQLSLPQFCFEALIQVLPQLKKKCSQEEANCLIELIYEFLTCVTLNLKPNIWHSHNDLKGKFYQIFGIMQELLKYHKTCNKILYVILLNIVIQLLNSLKPSSALDLDEILPKSLHLELGHCILDCCLYLMFPQLHFEIVKYLKLFLGQQEKELLQDFKDVLKILDSMKSTVKFLKNQTKFKTKLEKLQCAHHALPSLHFHKNFDSIHCFVSSCLLKWTQSELKDEELKIREQVLLKLLAHSSNSVKIQIYKEINDYAVKLLGEEEAAKPHYEFPGDKMEFLFQVDVLTEIICHGLNSKLAEVCKYSSNIIVYLLKSKFIMSEKCWSDFMAALIPCFSLIQCFADKSTSLGRCIIQMFDPDVAKSTGLPQIELLKGNIRLLFSKNNLTRDEAISRLFWLLNKEDSKSKKLPRINLLRSMNLSGICVSVKPKEYACIQQSFYNPGKLCDVTEMLGMENLEPNIRKSALTQLSVMLEDATLHSTFLEQKGLEKILAILDSSLVEREYRHYPDSVLPIIDVLKHISLQNAFVCQELGSKIDVFYNVLRGLFLFSSDERLRRNAVELLCLLLYSDCTYRVPSDKGGKCTISLPEIVVGKMILPFSTHVHWKNSRHFEPSAKKTLLSKESCSKLIRTYWATEWVGSLPDILAMQGSDLKEKIYYPGMPDDLKITCEDVEELKMCSFSLSVKQTLCDIQNATTHETVCLCTHKLHRYLLLHNISKATNGKNSNDVTSNTILSHMLWESTLERFLLSNPTCTQDESLLLLVIQFVQKILKSFKSDRLVNWMEKLLIDVNKPLYIIIRNLGRKNSSLKKRELELSIIELTQLVITSKPVLECKKWFSFMELLSDNLKLNKNGKEFYNVAYVDWLIGLLVDLTGKSIFAKKPECIKNLIVRIMEIIIAFHCTQDSATSFMGLNIVKNSLFVLNHILSDTQSNIEDWEEFWFKAMSSVIGHVENANYCWLLSLWFTRDPVVRAAAFQLFVGFSTTSKGCALLMDQLNVPHRHVWSEGFRILFDPKESCFVKEKCGLLLSNLICHGTKLSSGPVLEHLQKINFYQKIFEIVQNYQCENTLSELTLDEFNNVFIGEISTTPAFLISISNLIENLIFIKPTEVSENILENGVLESLIRVLGKVPESAATCDTHRHCVDILKMYINVCRLITKCVMSNMVAHSLVLQSQCTINYLFSMIDYNLFCEASKTITEIKTELWCEIFYLFSALLRDVPKNGIDENSAFATLKRCLTKNQIHHFAASLYIALTSDSSALRSAALQFLINLFYQEAIGQNQITIADIFETEISEQALQFSKCYGSKEFHISESLKLNFGIRLADILLQFFLLSSDDPSHHSFKKTIADALGGLFVVFEPAQNYLAKKDFAASVTLHLKNICVKFSLENAITLKKLSDKKRIEPLLQDVEILFQLISNFTYNNPKAQNDIANRDLSVVVHKLWPWCVIKPSLQVVTLKMLCNFTRYCNQGCRSLVLSSNFTVMSLKKIPGSVTLMNAIINQITSEMDLIPKVDQSQIICLCLQLLSNCCSVTECRSVISKGTIFQSFTKFHSNRKKRSFLGGESVTESWLKFLIAVSSHQEGQLALAKNQDLLDIIIGMAASSKFNHRIDALLILRNICFHQLNRFRMLSCCSLLSMLLDGLVSNRKEELKHLVHAIWALACNSQKDKLILRSAGFEVKLEAAKRNCVLNGDEETEHLIATVLAILRNK